MSSPRGGSGGPLFFVPFGQQSRRGGGGGGPAFIPYQGDCKVGFRVPLPPSPSHKTSTPPAQNVLTVCTCPERGMARQPGPSGYGLTKRCLKLSNAYLEGVDRTSTEMQRPCKCKLQMCPGVASSVPRPVDSGIGLMHYSGGHLGALQRCSFANRDALVPS